MLDEARDEAADPLVVVLSHGFWRSQFGSDPSIVGRTVRLNGRLLAVAGIAAEEFSGLSMDKPDLWAPLVQQPQIVTGSHLLTELNGGVGVRTWGRMQPGVTPQGVEQELRYIIAEFRQQHPAEIWEKKSLVSQPGGYAKSLMIGDRSGTGTEQPDKLYPMWVLIGSLVFLILAAACSNLGGLLLARGVSRRERFRFERPSGPEREG
ncbi:MAG: ABC transporter permease [Paludibaculum sp.]